MQSITKTTIMTLCIKLLTIINDWKLINKSYLLELHSHKFTLVLTSIQAFLDLGYMYPYHFVKIKLLYSSSYESNLHTSNACIVIMSYS